MSTSTTCKYTLTDSNGTSNAGTITVEVTATPIVEPEGDYERIEVPFSAASAWNIPIGTGATLESASATATAEWLNMSPPGLVLAGDQLGFGTGCYPVGGPWTEGTTSSDALYTVTADAGENGIGLPVTLRIPEAAKALTATSGDRTAVFVNLDTGVTHDFYHFRWDGSAFRAGLCRSSSINGLGHGTAPGERVGTSASGVSVLAGNLIPRVWATAGLEFPQMLMCTVPRHAEGNGLSLLNTQTILPACTIDSQSATRNRGNNPYGSVYTIPPSLNLSTLGLSEPGLRLAQCVRNRGIIIVDGGGTYRGNFRARKGLTQAQRTQIIDQFALIWPHTRRITNGAWFAGQTVRGGGTPLANNYGIST